MRAHGWAAIAGAIAAMATAACGGGQTGTGGAGGGAHVWKPTAAGAPALLHQGDCLFAHLDGWDAQKPWPLITMNIVDSGMDKGDLAITYGWVNDSKGDVYCTVPGNAWVYGWKPGAAGPVILYDGPPPADANTTVATIAGWDPAHPSPILAMEHTTQNEPVWGTVSVYGVGADGGVYIGSNGDRVIIWQIDAPQPTPINQPPASLKLPWDPEAPPPVIAFGDADHFGYAGAPFFRVKPDGSGPGGFIWSW